MKFIPPSDLADQLEGQTILSVSDEDEEGIHLNLSNGTVFIILAGVLALRIPSEKLH